MLSAKSFARPTNFLPSVYIFAGRKIKEVVYFYHKHVPTLPASGMLLQPPHSIYHHMSFNRQRLQGIKNGTERLLTADGCDG